MDRGRRRKPLSKADHMGIRYTGTCRRRDCRYRRPHRFGLRRCLGNKALKLHRSVHRLRQEVIDHYDDMLIAGGTEDATDSVLTTRR